MNRAVTRLTNLPAAGRAAARPGAVGPVVVFAAVVGAVGTSVLVSAPAASAAPAGPGSGGRPKPRVQAIPPGVSVAADAPAGTSAESSGGRRIWRGGSRRGPARGSASDRRSQPGTGGMAAGAPAAVPVAPAGVPGWFLALANGKPPGGSPNISPRLPSIPARPTNPPVTRVAANPLSPQVIGAQLLGLAALWAAIGTVVAALWRRTPRAAAPAGAVRAGLSGAVRAGRSGAVRAGLSGAARLGRWGRRSRQP